MKRFFLGLFLVLGSACGVKTAPIPYYSLPKEGSSETKAAPSPSPSSTPQGGSRR